MSVLTQEKGVVQAGAVGPALDYLAAEMDSPISIVRSLSYLSILVGLLGTVSLLALALQSVDVIGQFRIEQLKNIYPLNAIAIGSGRPHLSQLFLVETSGRSISPPGFQSPWQTSDRSARFG